MHLFKTTSLGCLLALTLTTPSSAYVVTVYSNPDCTGTARDINVYDNTCHAPANPGFAAFKVKTYGSAHQYAHFYEPGSCGDLFNGHEWWADGGSDTFLADGRCISRGVVWNALSSYWGVGRKH
ncbi:uncharacterized protein BJX67DRAFT_40676 [Aspergillus lucknowensis]|uniref:Uncharacterized protein n=1 Tax=Aspergillus lucknowensis TaxID=176173 RepID=A0ABR4M002_9EURO